MSSTPAAPSSSLPTSSSSSGSNSKKQEPLVYRGTTFEYVQDCFRYYKTLAERKIDNVKHFVVTYPTVFISYAILFGSMGLIYFRVQRKVKLSHNELKANLEKVKKQRIYDLVKEANEIKRLGK
ncbi:hypothetical protein FDP41_012722 [Naegleria fowleri]|uniref:Transmembrane protein n=1 Tax=Naegleria fowleri TaxID=5763 RepID=A0A6A5C318_NAEFO|nr:uncharacterized protein FDP41_012722 [Naegleria fowleri]KAF0980934.1 hypothetical protein FDP41_012722 [Naegleria fowleri]CAG4714768.1 unnamed protein product [Naegleria fowleri]